MPDAIINAVAVALVGGLTWLARRAIKAFEAKTKIDIDESTERLIDQLIEKGVRFVEEKYGRRKAADVSRSEAKKAEVKAFVGDELKKRGLNPVIGNIGERIDAKVHELFRGAELKAKVAAQ